jgi:hypothetical protein
MHIVDYQPESIVIITAATDITAAWSTIAETNRKRA